MLALQAWPRPGAAGPQGDVATGLGAALLLLVGAAALLGLLRGRPRLVLDAEGLALQGVLRTRRARWDRLGAFVLVGGRAERGGFRHARAVAPLLRPDGRPGRPVVLPDVLEAPLATVLAVLPRHRATAPDGADAQGRGGPGWGGPGWGGPGWGGPGWGGQGWGGQGWGGQGWGGRDGDLPRVLPERSVGVAGFRLPWLTLGLLAGLVAVFVAEQRLAISPAGPGLSPALDTLVALGGLSRSLVADGQDGQWYRMLTAPLLHGGLAHLGANAVALVLAGIALERLVGRAWLACVFAAGALAGSAASLAMNPPGTVSVGASGAIMAMLVALFAVSMRLPAGRAKVAIQVQSARVAIPALLPLGGAAAQHIDYGAHLGGAALGAVLGLLLLGTWEEHAPLPPLRAAAAGLAASALLALGVGTLAVARHYPAYVALREVLIPPAELPHGAQALAARADALLATHPGDPRAHVAAALQALQRHDDAAAEAQLQQAMTLQGPLATVLPPKLGPSTGALLAFVQLAQGRRPEALRSAAPACAAAGPGAVPAQVRAALLKVSLCVGPGP